jgi:uncharacterized protein YkwD
MLPRFLPLIAAAAVLLLGGCSLSGVDEPVGSVVREQSSAGPAVLDPAAAVAMVSAYRRSHGLSAVTINTKLTAIAAIHARRMVDMNRMDHVLPGEGSFMGRMTAGGYDAAVAAENIGAGYRNLSDAIAGWKRSPHHNENLLLAGVTEIGIATAYGADTRFKNYWSLVLATPFQPPSAASGGPFSVLR